MSFSFVELPDSHPAFIERPMELPRKVVAAAGATGSSEPKLVSQDVKQSREQELRRNRSAQGHFFR
jgi:hypothetical protein